MIKTVNNSTSLSNVQKIFFSTLSYLLIIGSILGFTQIAKWTVIHSGLNFDFENLMGLSLNTYLSLAALILLLLLVFYLNYIINLRIKDQSLNNWTRMSCLILAVLVSFPIFHFSNLGVATFPYYLSVTSFLFLSDLFIDRRETSIIWIIFWMITLSSLSSILLFNFYLTFDINKKVSFAKSLVNERDDDFIKELRSYDYFLDQSNALNFLDSIPAPLKIHKVEFNEELSRTLKEYPVIDGKSKAILNAFDKYDNSMVYDKFTTKAFYREFIRNSVAVDTNIYFDPVSNGYVLEKKRNIKNHPDSPFSIYLEFLPTDKYESPDKLLSHTFQRYHQEPDYAVYINENLKGSNAYDFNKRSDIAKELEPGAYKHFYQDGISHLIYKYDNRTSIHLKSKFAKIIKPILLFSFLFILMGVLLSLIAVINTKWSFLPKQFLLKLNNISSLKRRIQLSVILLSIFSFLIIGIVTIYYFRYLSKEYDKDLIREKTVAITADVSARLQSIDESLATLQKIEAEKYAISKLEVSIHDLSETHQMDLHLFDKEGKLINSSAPKFFELGFAANLLNRPLLNLLEDRSKIYASPELAKVGDLAFTNIYIPIKYNQDDKNIAYLQLLHTPQIKTQNNVTDFVGTLLNVYVFLFLLAGAIALAVANSITRPISVLGDQIKNFKLGRKSKKLEWDSEDELGDLIRNYNKMAEQLDESAILIAKTERDSAWREMAKQVAHEIKNPD